MTTTATIHGAQIGIKLLPGFAVHGDGKWQPHSGTPAWGQSPATGSKKKPKKGSRLGQAPPFWCSLCSRGCQKAGSWDVGGQGWGRGQGQRAPGAGVPPARRCLHPGGPGRASPRTSGGRFPHFTGHRGPRAGAAGTVIPSGVIAPCPGTCGHCDPC